ncbi:MAG: hypothetical protein AB7T38_01610 [Nitrospirales bacterium]
MQSSGNGIPNVGGNYLTVGYQSYNIRGVGLISSLSDIGNIVVTEKEGTPIFSKAPRGKTAGY